MDTNQKALIIVLLCISLLTLFIPMLIVINRRLTNKSPYNTSQNLGISKMLVFSVCLIVSVWCLRYAVGYYSIVSSLSALNWLEEIFNSTLHALQTFSMDEEYTEYIINGKMMIQSVFGDRTLWQTAYGVYASILNLAAPIAGGAIIFEILASIFPKIKLYFSHFARWKDKHYFSELNNASLALARSILSKKYPKFKKPVIIFTDAYIDDENEKSSELLLEAKSIGAICVRDDLTHVKKNRRGLRTFYLVDEDGSGNLHTLVDLADSKNSLFLKNSEIYFFTNDDAYIQVEKSVRDKLQGEGFNFSDEELPVFIPVNGYRNLITNLLASVPLYEPLIGKNLEEGKSQKLTVTILGTGHIGTEMFLSTYWFGQILNCNLIINVLSQESEDEFWNKIDYVNPEIKQTTEDENPILLINRTGEKAEKYCEVKYTQCDVKSSEFIKCLTEQSKGVLDTDYFLVSLGSDEVNISVANTVQKYVGQHHINMRKDDIGSSIKSVIAYVVYDSELSETLNRKKFYNYVDDKMDVYMQAIGSMDDVYSINNITMTEYLPFAKNVETSYFEIQDRKNRAEKHKGRLKDDYKYWASLARAMHVKYKIYSMNLIKASMFDFPNDSDKHNEKQKEAYEKYKEIAKGQIQFKSESEIKEFLELLHKMAWLEHRRWNAFTRIKGFRCTKNYDIYAKSGEMGSYKEMDLKLHPCLVECDKKGIKGSISPTGKIDEHDLLKCEDRTEFDLLDDLSYDLYEKRYNNYDFKQYDYPMGDF